MQAGESAGDGERQRPVAGGNSRELERRMPGPRRRADERVVGEERDGRGGEDG